MGHEMKGKNIYDVFKSSLDFAPATALHRNHLSTLEGAIKGFRVFKATLFVLRRGGTHGRTADALCYVLPPIKN